MERFGSRAAGIFVLIAQTMVNIVPSYHPIARAKLSGRPKQRRALVFEQNPPTKFRYNLEQPHFFGGFSRSITPPHNDSTW